MRARATRGPQDATGFTVAIREKTHHTLLELISKRASSTRTVRDVPRDLLLAGNCIPAALWHVLPERRQARSDACRAVACA
jgi:hypothetical protein